MSYYAANQNCQHNNIFLSHLYTAPHFLTVQKLLCLHTKKCYNKSKRSTDRRLPQRTKNEIVRTPPLLVQSQGGFSYALIAISPSCMVIIAYIPLSANQNSIGQFHPRRTISGSDVYIFFRPFFPSFRWPCCTKFPSTFLRKYEESLIFNREAISATL